MSERHARSPWCVIVVALTLLAGSGAARAQGAASTAFELDWRAPVGCPSGDHVRAEITRMIGPDAHPQGVTHVSGEITAQDGGAFLVTLSLEQAGRTGERTLTAASFSRSKSARLRYLIAPADRDQGAAQAKILNHHRLLRRRQQPLPAPPPAPLPHPPAVKRKTTSVVIALGPAAEVQLLPTLGTRRPASNWTSASIGFRSKRTVSQYPQSSSITRRPAMPAVRSRCSYASARAHVL